MTITVTYDGIEERDEAIDAISISGYRHLVHEVDVNLWNEWDHGGHTGKAAALMSDLWEMWCNVKADLPRGGE